jgi:predicted peroxiredoxin
MSKILVKSAWGSDDPTKSAFPFLHANALAKAGHEVQIFILGEATPLMRDALMQAIHPVGWPPLAETFQETISLAIHIHV